MEENNTAAKKGFLAWLDNFWYHYKWHSIVALFLIFTLTICSLQFCQKESYDVYIMYAGSHEIKRTSATGDIPEYQKTKAAFEKVAGDFNDDGEISLSLKDIFMLSSEEIFELENKDDGTEVNYSLLTQNTSILNDTMIYSSYYVCLLSPSMYEEYKAYKNVKMFSELSELVNDGNEVSYYASDAVYLSSTDFYLLPGVCELPEDTLICLRAVSDYASSLGKKEAKAQYENAKTTVSNILNY